jgi:hypothetical protein
MKHTPFIVCLIITTMISTTFAMERFVELQQQPINTINIQTVNTIDIEINGKYGSKLLPDALVALALTDKDKLDIVNRVNKYCKANNVELSKQLINTLYKNNVFFETAIDHFITFARQNIHEVTYETIDKIGQLNTIAPPIKEYVIKTTCKEMCTPYDITLAHNSNVHLFAIHPKSGTVASCCNDNSLHIWNLKTGAIEKEIKTPYTINILQFNQNGSLLGTVHTYKTKNNDEKYCIKIRDTKTAAILYKIKQYDRVYHMSFMQKEPTQVVAVFAIQQNNKYARQDRLLRLYQLTENNTCTDIGSFPPLPWRCEQYVEFSSDKKKYEGHIDEDNCNNIQITTKQRTALHLCTQAIENHNNASSIHTIEQSQTYQRLTEYEKQLVANKIAHQKTLLQKNQLLKLTSQRK